jgi:hypothetical protein
MELETDGMNWVELALRFAAFAPAVSSAIVGTLSIDLLLQTKNTSHGPLPMDCFESRRELFRRHDVIGYQIYSAIVDSNRRT